MARKHTSQGGADAVARVSAECEANEKTGKRGEPVGRKRLEARDALTTKDSGFGKSKPARPTADEVEKKVDGADKIPFKNLPPATQTELRRRRALRGRQPEGDAILSEAVQRAGQGGVINPGFSTDPAEAHPRPHNPLAEHPKSTT